MSNIRNKWLLSFLLLLGVNLILGLLSLLFASQGDKKEAIIGIITIAIWGWITYHCAYRKRGTTWLMWQLIVSPFRMIKDMAELNVNGAFDLIGIILMCLIIPIYLWFWVNSFKYRKENLLLKTQTAPKKNPRTKKLWRQVLKKIFRFQTEV